MHGEKRNIYSKTTFVTVNQGILEKCVKMECDSKTTFVTVNPALATPKAVSFAIQKQPLLLLIPRF